MDTNKKYGLLQVLGLVFFIQAVTSLIGGSMTFGPLDANVITKVTMANIAQNTFTLYTSILLQMVTGIVIIVLATILYVTTCPINKTLASVALCLYVVEAGMLMINQTFVFALSEASQTYLINGDPSLIALSNLLLACKDFTGKMAMMPFGLGALAFYYLLMKAEIIPKWLALWGLLSVPLILICVPLMAFGLDIPFFLVLPYVPFEFFTGIFILIKYKKKALHQKKIDFS